MNDIIDAHIRIGFCFCMVVVQVVLDIAPQGKCYAQKRLCEIDIVSTIDNLKSDKEFLNKLITEESVEELQRMKAASCEQIKNKK